MKKFTVSFFAFLLLALLLPVGAFATDRSTSMQVGSMQVDFLVDDMIDGDTSLLRNASPKSLQTYLPTGKFPLPVTVALVRESNKTMLIDTGIGTNLVKLLSTYDITPDTVDTILITHMHFDHMSGLLHDGKKVFPNAELYIAQKEAAYWGDMANLEQMSPAAREENRKYFLDAQAVLRAYKNKLHLFTPQELDGTHAELLPGVTAIAAKGHTPGNTVYLLHQKKEKLMLLGDVLHAQDIQFARPEVTLIYDADQVQAAQTRQAIFAYLYKNAIPFTAAHLTAPHVGTLKKHPAEANGYIFKPYQ